MASRSPYDVTSFASLRAWSAIAALLVITVLASSPADLNGQAVLAVATIAMFLMMSWLEPARGPIRVFVFLMTVFTSTRYMLWRAAETMPEGDLVSYVFALILFGAEIYGFMILLLSTFLSVDVTERRPQPAPVAPEHCPTVDILIPTYNEDDELIEVTLRAALNVSYPRGRVNVYLLDDGGTVAKRTQADPVKAQEALQRYDRLNDLCERAGATYLTREKNEHAKAGNLNSALQHTDGELILILDADHVPTRDILTRTVGYFKSDPKLFLVQTPHFFLNPDPLERNLDTFGDMPSENEMFYGVIQKGLDGFNASFFCGSAAILRRKCLMEIGGIQGDTITEDAETALELHSRGYNSAYVATPMVAGLAPETFTGFIVQRMRWAQGMCQIFLMKNPLTKKGLTMAQRFGYLNSCFFWFFPLARMAFLLAPLAYLIFGIQVFAVGVGPFLAYGLPHIVGAILLSSTLYGRSRWVFASELYEMIQAVHCSGAILQVFRNPRAPTFAVTPKGENLENAFISPLAKPFYILIALVAAGEIGGFIRMAMSPDEAGFIAAALMWNTFHLFLLLGSLGALYERHQRRVFPRIDRDMPISVLRGNETISARAVDLSVTGIGIRLPLDMRSTLQSGDTVVVDARAMGAASSFPLELHVKSMFEKEGDLHVGLRFSLENQEQWRAVVSLVYSRSNNWRAFQARRSTSGRMFAKVGYLIRLSVRRALDHLFEILKTVKA